MTVSAADRQARRPSSRTPRRRLHRPVRMAARQVRSRGHRLPRGRERLHRSSRPTCWRRCGRRSSTRSRPAPRRPTCRCPTRRGDWWYYGRSFEGKQYGVQCRCPVGDPDDWTPPELDEHTEIPGEQVLLDENVEADGHDFFSLGAASVSLDGDTLAYSVDVVGDERYTLRFKDLRTGELYDDTIVGHRRRRHVGGRQPHRLLRHRRRRVAARHRVAPPARRRVCPPRRCITKPDERFWLAVGRTRSDKYVFIAAGSAVTTEMFYGDAADPETDVHVDPAAPRTRRVLRRARGGRRRGPLPDPAQRRRRELHPRRGAGQRPDRVPHADPAPRRRPARRGRRVRRPRRGQLPQRGVAANPAVADLRRRQLRASRGDRRSRPS